MLRDFLQDLRYGVRALRRTDAFEGVAAINVGECRVESAPGAPPDLLMRADVSEDYFRVFKVQPRLGRLFLPDEYQPGRDRVVLLSSQLWQSRYASDPGIVGRRIRVDGELHTVLGVMPPELHDPLRYWSRGQMWRPLVFGPSALADQQEQWLRLIARLAPGVSRGSADAAVGAVAARLDAEHQTGSRARLVTPQETGAMDVAGTRVVWLSLGLGVFLLLLACVNLAGVQLARLAARGHDLAVRAALGAGRARLVRGTLAESLLVSLLGGVASVPVAQGALDLVASRMIIGGRWTTVGVPARLDARVLGFALLLVVVTAAAVGAVPAWLAARGALARALRSGGRGTADRGSAWARLRQALVVGEMALALVLLAGGGLFLRGLHRFVNRDVGWRVDGLLTARLQLPGPQYRGEAGAAFLERLQQRLAALPGVEAVALADGIPFWETGYRPHELLLEGRPPARVGRGPAAFTNAVTPTYFKTAGLSLRDGRLFTPADRPPAEPVAVVNESIARGLWPGQSAVGKRLGDARGDPTRPRFWRTVVGVVADARFAGTLTAPASRYQIYTTIRFHDSPMVVLRTTGAPEALAAGVRQLVAELAPEAPLTDVHTARAIVERTLINVSLLGWTLFAFAALGLVLSALGVYGLFAGYVVERTREIGLRMALGAQAGQVLALVLGKGLRLAVLGGLLGVAGAAAAVALLAAMVPELPAHEPLAVVVLALVLIAVALFACWLPARRAAALDPMVALRQE